MLSDLILNVSAKDKATGKKQSIEIKAPSGLTDEEIEQMVKDAEAHAEEDKKFEALVQARNMGEHLVHSCKKTLEEAGDKAEADEKEAIEKGITELEEALKSDDKDRIDEKIKDRKSTRLNSSHVVISYAVFCLKKKN